MVDKLTSALETVKEEMTNGEVPPSDADKPKTETEENDVPKKIVKKKVVTAKKKVVTAKKKTVVASSPVKKTRTEKSDENLVTLKALSKELKIDPRAARVVLRKSKTANPGRWSWPVGSGELTKVRKLLSSKE
jgi:hypothetical protein